VEKAGGWVERKHGKKKRIVKLHFAVRVDTHEVVSMEVTTDDVHDSKEAAGLLEGAERRPALRRRCWTGRTTPRRSTGSWRSVGSWLW